jgi:aminoglycoside 3-N-acetyltransferase
MISFRDISVGFRKLELDPRAPLLVHASLSALGEVRGGAETVLAALLACSPMLMMPAFTYRTLVTPEAGPDHNALTYGASEDQNRLAEFFTMEMPADPSMGILAETLRRAPGAKRSQHPILSFAGVNVPQALAVQSLREPLNPIAWLAQQGGWVVLLGVNHTANTSIHYAERLAGRKQFTRWGLTYEGVVECPAFPGCSNGFDMAGLHLAPITSRVQIGAASVQAFPLQPALNLLVKVIQKDPLSLLCGDPNCARCAAVRSDVFHLSHP